MLKQSITRRWLGPIEIRAVLRHPLPSVVDYETRLLERVTLEDGSISIVRAAGFTGKTPKQAIDRTTSYLFGKAWVSKILQER